MVDVTLPPLQEGQWSYQWIIKKKLSDLESVVLVPIRRNSVTLPLSLRKVNQVSKQSKTKF